MVPGSIPGDRISKVYHGKPDLESCHEASDHKKMCLKLRSDRKILLHRCYHFDNNVEQPKIAFQSCTCGLVAMTSASHAEGRQFDPGQVYRFVKPLMKASFHEVQHCHSQFLSPSKLAKVNEKTCSEREKSSDSNVDVVQVCPSATTSLTADCKRQICSFVTSQLCCEHRFHKEMHMAMYLSLIVPLH